MQSDITTTNPYTEDKIHTYTYYSKQKIQNLLHDADERFHNWKITAIKERTQLLNAVASHLEAQVEHYSALITTEMGKPITESRSELKKCIDLCHFYSANAEQFLADTLIESEAHESFISYDPLGCVLGIMPWNFPFWQAFRFAIPTLTAGNTVLLKHAANVTGCAMAIETIFKTAGYPEGCFTTLLADHDTIETIIQNDIVKAVSLTGSEKAGRTIAKIAGAALKPIVLELGGNNACVVLADADLDAHIDTIVKARMQNAGQSCIAAKRFIVEAPIYDVFLEQFTKKVAALKVEDPQKDSCEIGVLARKDLADTLAEQVKASIAKGAHLHYGNTQQHAYYQPTILTNVTPDMPVFTEETFGPVAAIIKVANAEEAYALARNTTFGLGTMVFTAAIEDAKRQIINIPDGSFFINDMVKSNPELPFGGTKASGYGRELSKEGLFAFTNKKTVYIK